MSCLRMLWAVSVLLCLVAWVDAAPIFYRTSGDFETALTSLAGAPQRFDFEQEFVEQIAVDFGGVAAREVSSAPAVSSRSDYFADGRRAMGFTWNGDGFFELTFDPPVTAFGTTIIDFGTCCGATELRVQDFDNLWLNLAALGPDRPRGNWQFFGVVSDLPMSHLRFTSNDVSTNDLIVFDAMTIVAVPEPTSSSLGLLTLGLLVGGRRLWR